MRNVVDDAAIEAFTVAVRAAGELRDALSRCDAGGIAGYRQWPAIDRRIVSMQCALGREEDVGKHEADD